MSLVFREVNAEEEERGQDVYNKHNDQGGVDESYGVDVAKLAGLPAKVVARAKELLEEMERSHVSERPVGVREESGQISFGSLGREAALDMLEKTNIDELSDTECRELLADMLKAIQ